MIKETARLREEIEKELLIDDPELERAEAILRGENEDSEPNDGRGSDKSDSESGEENLA